MIVALCLTQLCEKYNDGNVMMYIKISSASMAR